VEGRLEPVEAQLVESPLCQIADPKSDVPSYERSVEPFPIVAGAIVELHDESMAMGAKFLLDEMCCRDRFKLVEGSGM
jgi:hypothetical protein